jgi:hypothetical protein
LRRKKVALGAALLMSLAIFLPVNSKVPYQYRPYDGKFASIYADYPSKIEINQDYLQDLAPKIVILAPKVVEITPKPKKIAKKASKPVKTINKAYFSHRLRGVATWYCRPGVSRCTRGYPYYGAYGAAGPALRAALGGGNRWRGRTVYVNGVAVKLIDWCACGGSHTIDIYYSTWIKIGWNIVIRW